MIEKVAATNAGIGQWILLVDDDRALGEGLAAALEQPGRTVVVCADVESAEMALDRFPVTDVLTDVQFSGVLGYEGLRFLERMHGRNGGVRAVMMTGRPSETLQAAASAIGVPIVLTKPFLIDELEAALRPDEPWGPAGPARTLRVPTIGEVIHQGSIAMAFQPIVPLAGSAKRPMAFEALVRGKRRFPLGGAAALFDYASRCSRLDELNRASMRCAIAEAGRLPAGAALFVNVDPIAFDESFVEELTTATGRHGIDAGRIVLEVTERSGFPDPNQAARLFDSLRERGVRFALDDHGSAYSHLELITRIRPSFVKISSRFGTGFESDEAKGRLVRHIAALARDFEAASILEGVETAETAEAARDAGIDFAQGYYFGRPRSASRWAAPAPRPAA